MTEKLRLVSSEVALLLISQDWHLLKVTSRGIYRTGGLQSIAPYSTRYGILVSRDLEGGQNDYA